MNANARSLLVAIAHPDDENFGIGGTMAKLAVEGWRVTVVCATRGEVGEIADPALATPETLGAVREQELRRACQILGVNDVRFLGYRDSGMEGTPENADPRALANAVPAAAIEAFAAVIRDVGPRLVITWDPSGGYGHPDHRAVHRFATAAFEQTAGSEARALYYTALPVKLFREMAAELERQGVSFGSDEMRERADQLPHLPVTTEIDVSAFVAKKFEALSQHATQMPADSPFQRLPSELRDRFAGTEYFYRAVPAWQDGHPIERAFWRANATIDS